MSFDLPRPFMEAWERLDQPGAIHDGYSCLMANQPFAAMFGYVRPEDVEGRPMGEFISPWPTTSPRVGTRNVMGRHRNGSSMDLEATCVPFPLGDRILYQSLIRDVTQLRSWEGRLLESERLTAMGRLAGEIAHEINNPLGGILLYANLLREDLEQEGTVRANLEKIIKLATRCRIIAKGLLNFGRSSSKTLSPTDLNQVIRDVFSMVEDHRMFAHVDVEMDLPEKVPHIMADKSQMEQVVLNLIVNAGEAMGGRGMLAISTTHHKERKVVELVVEDSGPGVPEDIRSRIFEPFFTTKRPGKGTGLGLAITLGIVQRHRGQITVESGAGRGSIFRVTLPASSGG